MNSDNFPSFVKKLLNARRKNRIIKALSKVTTKPNMKIIDIGCGRDGRSFENFIPENWHVVGIDLKDPQIVKHTFPNFQYVQQDAQNLSQFADKQFDLAVSIGLLEHVTDEKAFKKTALEIRRVAKQYLIMVPAKYCSIEPHYGLPFFPLIPYSIQLFLIKTFNLSNQRGFVTSNPDNFKNEIIWRSNQEYQRAFPESKIYYTSTLEQIVIIKKDVI